MAAATRWSKFLQDVWSLLVLFFVILQSVTSSDSRLITSSLDAKWKTAPLILEASEYIAKESNEKFWKFVELSQDADLIHTERDKYNFILKNAGEILSPVTLNLLKFSLSVRFYSPRVELYMKVAEQLPPPDCKAFVAIGDKLICDIKKAVKLIESSDKIASSQTNIEFDHHYPNSEDNPVTAVLYGEIGTPEFYTIHQQLVKLAKKGKVHYVVRHYVKSLTGKKVRLSGYGVELAVKSTEYKAVDDSKVKDDTTGGSIKKAEEDEEEVDGFLFGKLRKLHPELKEQLEQFKIHLKESSREIASLKVWQIQDLSFQAAQRVLSSESQRALRVLRDLSQNLPTQAKSLVKTNVDEKMRKEIKENQKVFASSGIEPGDSALSINGILLNVEDLNPFDLLKILRDEGRVMDQLASLGIKGESLSGLASMAVQSEHDDYVLDIRNDGILYVNDLEKDRMYANWPSNIQELLRPTFPGMMRYIAKNIFHVVFVLDPTNVHARDMIQAVEEFLLQSMPARLGFVLVTDAPKEVDAKTNAAVAIARAVSFISAEKEPRQALEFLTRLYRDGDELPTAKQVYNNFVSLYSKDDAEDVFGSDSEYDEWRKASKRFYDKTGFKTLPQVIVNGVPIKSDEFDVLEEAVTREILMQTGPLQHAVYMGRLHPHQDVLEYVMSKPNVVSRMNDVIQSVDRPTVDLSGSSDDTGTDLSSAAEFAVLDSAQMVSVFNRKIKYFTKKGDELSLKPITSWVIVDLSTQEGRSLLLAALNQMKSSTSVRVGILHNPGVRNSTDQSKQYLLAQALEAVLGSKEYTTPAMLAFLEKLLDKENDFSKLLSDTKVVLDIVRDVKGLKVDNIEASLKYEALLMERINSHQLFCKTVLNLSPGANAVVTNGRVLGPLSQGDIFSQEDFQLLEDFDMDVYARKVSNKVDGMLFANLSADDDTSEFRSNVIMKASSVLLGRQTKKRNELKYQSSEHSTVTIKSDSDVMFDVMALLDPLTKDAQRLTPILMVLENVTDVNIRVLMNCREKHSEMPLKRFYRYVLESQLSFDSSGFANQGPLALFENMPQSPLLTMSMDTPLGWMVEAVRSPYDLDNIRLQEAEQGVHASFELEYIFIEGHCVDARTGQPPRGLQFTLGTKANPATFDTIVMANLGYFQLKAFPGAWVLQLREGQSSKIYDIESLTGGQRQEGSGTFTVIVDSFTGKLMKTKVKRKPGMERADLLGDEGDESAGGLWDSISSIVSSEPKKKTTKDETINIFSVASGHLYERFMRIMMISVLRHTKSPVKFWFLKNFLSPTFTAFMPFMAKKYGFEYELVQYQWPRWLHAQTEKQRVIWGYKILFLDVLFPLGLNRIIFVDADLIVRTDLKELNDMSLDGAPYAYTPFCDSRTEMDGFRFWKQGYWRSHLGYRPYHISALYVVDLKRFRSIAAGDRLRGQYQGLSQDPNSLANLDQDLPNNMIHQVPIKSLPQEWLWCETWCDDYSKQSAKTIDLCNNPMTKEPKLERAKRIIKEWPEYDNEIRKLQEQYADNLTSETQEKIAKPETKQHVEL